MYNLSMQSLENLILMDVFEPGRDAWLGTSRMQFWHRVNRGTYHGLYATLGDRFMISKGVETLDISKSRRKEHCVLHF